MSVTIARRLGGSLRRGTESGSLALALLLGMTGAVGLGVAAGTLLRAFLPLQINENEGWNAFHQMAAAAGQPLYPAPGALVFNNYPPLSFWIVGLAARLGADPVMVGRLLSWVSVLAIAALSARTVRNLAPGSRAGPVAAGVATLACLCLASTGYVGMNDPQFLGNAFEVAALAAYTRGPDRMRPMAVALLLMAAAGLIKQNLVAVPLAVAADAVLAGRRRAIRFVLSAALALAIVMAGLMLLFGPAIFHDLLTPRTYRIDRAMLLSKDVIRRFDLLLFVSGAWLLGRRMDPAPRLVLLYMAAAGLAGVVLAGGAGTAANMFFDLGIAAGMGLGIVVAELCRGRGGLPGLAGRTSAAVLVLASLAGLVAANTDNLKQLAAALRRGPASPSAQFRADIVWLRHHPGPAVCEDPLVCFRAGKAFLLDSFNATQAELLGHLDRAVVDDVPDGQAIRVIELNAMDTDRLLAGLPPADPLARWAGFSDAFLRNVGRNYRLDRHTGQRGFFVARRAPGEGRGGLPGAPAGSP